MKGTDKDKKLFGERLRKLRTEKGYKGQREFSQDLGVPLDTYKKWEQGTKFPKRENLQKIIDLTKCGPEYFSGETDQKNYDLQFICENTGLSGQAVENLQILLGCSPETLEVLNYILETQISMEEPEDNILYKIRECLQFETVFKDKSDDGYIMISGSNAPPVKISEYNKMYAQYHYEQITQDLASQRRKHLFYKWQNGIKEYKYRKK